MSTGALTSYFDVAQITLYGFWIFFAGLILYLRTEDKREGYPLESDRSSRIRAQGFPPIPRAKEFLLQRGTIRVAPDAGKDARDVAAAPIGDWPGAPLQPSGDPMAGAVGPGSYAMRENVPDLTFDGHPKIVPLRVATGYSVEPRDPDPRGMDVIGADGQKGGVVRDLWVDQSDYLFRYLEVEVPGPTAPRHILLPINFSRIDGGRRQVKVRAVLGAQLAGAPGLAQPDQVTFLEEDKVVAYFGGGTLFASPARVEPLL